MKYDADQTPEKENWLSMDEDERIESVTQHHKRLKIKLPNIRLHSVFHIIVENQIAEGIEEVQKKLDELISDGLSRHDAVHAIGSVMSESIYHLMKGEPADPDVNKDYFRKLSKLTAKKWLEMS